MKPIELAGNERVEEPRPSADCQPTPPVSSLETIAEFKALRESSHD
jgi:hypothetical protein